MSNLYDLDAALKKHAAFDGAEDRSLQQTRALLREHGGRKNVYCRTAMPGHITASAWVVDPDRKKVLLLLHGKAKIWSQPGGHCDGESDVLAAALREVTEETGLRQITAHGIFDVDVHAIPAREPEPEHFHHDVRYRVHASCDEPILCSDESDGLRWVTLAQAREIVTDGGVFRMIQKTETLFESMEHEKRKMG